MAKKSTIAIVSNVSDWSTFFDKLLAIIKTNNKQFMGRRKLDIGLQVVNLAQTESRKGKPFYYFKAVDKGRSSVVAGKRVLKFTVESPAALFSDEVGPAAGFDITIKAVSEIQARFSAQVTKRFKQFLNSGTVVVSDSGPAGDSPRRAKVGNLKITGERLHSKTTTKRKKNSEGKFDRVKIRQVTRESEEISLIPNLSATKIVGSKTLQGEKKKLLAQAARSGGDALKLLNKIPSTIKGKAAIQGLTAGRNKAIEMLMTLQDKPAVAALFLDVVEEQIRIFQKHTPERSQFKLLADGEALAPDKPGEGELRNSYAVLSDGEILKD